MTKISQFMSKNVVTGSAKESVQDIAVKMKKYNISTVLIINEDKSLSGIVTERDIVQKLVSLGLDPSKTITDKIMTEEIITGDPTWSIVKAATVMKNNGIKRLPMVEDHKLVGIVTQTDILKILSYK